MKGSPKRTKIKAERLKEEKTRLQGLINDRIAKIEKLKAVQIIKKQQTSQQMKVLRHAKRSPVNKRVEKIVTQDKIELTSGSETDLEVLNSILSRPRRLSLTKADGLTDSLPLFVRMSSAEDKIPSDIATPKSLTVKLMGNTRVAKESSPALQKPDVTLKQQANTTYEDVGGKTHSKLTHKQLLQLSVQYVSVYI